MRIAFIPRYTRHAASSRLRCYAIAEAIQRQGLAEVWIAEQGYVPERTAVAVLQKAVDPDVFARAAFAGRIIYDADDIVEHATKSHICRWAFAVTTDTELRAKGIREWFRGPVHVIPDPIDYEDGPPKPPNPEAHDGVVWFGNWPNFESVRQEFLRRLRNGERVGAISDLSPERANMPGLELIPWSYETFPQELRKWRGCVLSHEGSDPCKSENKLVAALYLGIVEGSAWGRAYENLLDKLKGMDIAGMQDYIWEHYRADVIARKAMEVYAG